MHGADIPMYIISSDPMIGENRQLVTNEPVEFEVYKEITDHFRGIYRIYPRFNKGKPEDVNM